MMSRPSAESAVQVMNVLQHLHPDDQSESTGCHTLYKITLLLTLHRREVTRNLVMIVMRITTEQVCVASKDLHNSCRNCKQHCV